MMTFRSLPKVWGILCGRWATKSSRSQRVGNYLQSGSGTLDALLGLGLVATFAVPTIAHYVGASKVAQVKNGVAMEMSTVALAASQYIKADYGSFAVGSARIMTGNFGLAGDLPSGFGVVGGPYSATTDITTQYGTYSLYTTTKSVVTPQGTSSQISAVLILNQGGPCYRGSSGSATTGTVNGVTLVLVPCNIVPAIASMIGSQGGYAPGAILPNPSGYAVIGSTGSWGLASGNPLVTEMGSLQAGTLAVSLNFSPQSLMSTALSRTNIGNTAANTMFTNLAMGGNTITGANEVQTSTLTSPSGAINFDGNAIQDVTTVYLTPTTTSVWAPVYGIQMNTWTTVPLYPNYISWNASNSDSGGSECSSQISYWTGHYINGTPETKTTLTGLWAC